MRFLDATVFINWFKGIKKDLEVNPKVYISGFILYKIEKGESAVTSSIVKDEVAIWLSRYRRSRLSDFLEALPSYTTLKVLKASIEDQIAAERNLGLYPLGYTDCVNLSLMKKLGIKEIYTSDKGFDKVKGVKRVFEELKDDPELETFRKWAKLNL